MGSESRVPGPTDVNKSQYRGEVPNFEPQQLKYGFYGVFILLTQKFLENSYKFFARPNSQQKCLTSPSKGIHIILGS